MHAAAEAFGRIMADIYAGVRWSQKIRKSGFMIRRFASYIIGATISTPLRHVTLLARYLTDISSVGPVTVINYLLRCLNKIVGGK
jgi:hypothetical protein